MKQKRDNTKYKMHHKFAFVTLFSKNYKGCYFLFLLYYRFSQLYILYRLLVLVFYLFSVCKSFTHIPCIPSLYLLKCKTKDNTSCYYLFLKRREEITSSYPLSFYPFKGRDKKLVSLIFLSLEGIKR